MHSKESHPGDVEHTEKNLSEPSIEPEPGGSRKPVSEKERERFFMQTHQRVTRQGLAKALSEAKAEQRAQAQAEAEAQARLAAETRAYVQEQNKSSETKKTHATGKTSLKTRPKSSKK